MEIIESVRHKVSSSAQYFVFIVVVIESKINVQAPLQNSTNATDYYRQESGNRIQQQLWAVCVYSPGRDKTSPACHKTGQHAERHVVVWLDACRLKNMWIGQINDNPVMLVSG